MKPIARVLFIIGLLASTLTVKAQISYIQASQINHTAESLFLGLTAYSAGTFTENNCDWTSPTAPASLSAGGTITGGVYDGYNYVYGIPLLSGISSNAGARGLIRGKNNNGGTASYFFAGCHSTRAATVVLWGPTLNSFGLTGAANTFTWQCSTAGGTTWGTGETTFSLSAAQMASGVTIYIFPGNDNELGHVMANFYNN